MLHSRNNIHYCNNIVIKIKNFKKNLKKMSLMHIHVLEFQENSELENNPNLGKKLFLPIDRLVEQTNFQQVFLFI